MSCIQTAPADARCARHASPLDAVGHALGRFARAIALWHGRYQQRRLLRELDAHLLKDIGVTPAEAAREAAKPFWID